MSDFSTYKGELLALGYPSTCIDQSYETYKRTHMALDDEDDDIVDRDALLEILIDHSHHIDTEYLSKQEHRVQCLVFGFIRQFEVGRLQVPVVINQMCLPFYGSAFIISTALTLDDVLALQVGDQLDHRDFAGLFASATVLRKEGARIYLHYDDWSPKWDRWSDGEKELFRFAKHESVSKQEAHRMTGLREGDYVDVNPIHTRPRYKVRHAGWKHAEIKQICDGQLKVSYKVPGGCPFKDYLYWVHLDNVDEVAPFTSKAGSVRMEQESYPLDSIHDHEEIFAESLTNNLRPVELFGDEHALDSCLAKELFGKCSSKHLSKVKQRCGEWMEQNQAEMERARSMVKYMGCGQRENALHLKVMCLADAFSVRIKVYTFEEHTAPNEEELVTLWADYSGKKGRGGAECPLICLAKLRNAFAVLHSVRGDEKNRIIKNGF